MVLKLYTQFIPITKDEYKSRLSFTITRGAQSGYRQRLDTSDYGELLLEHLLKFVYIFFGPPVYFFHIDLCHTA